MLLPMFAIEFLPMFPLVSLYLLVYVDDFIDFFYKENVDIIQRKLTEY